MVDVEGRIVFAKGLDAARYLVTCSGVTDAKKEKDR